MYTLEGSSEIFNWVEAKVKIAKFGIPKPPYTLAPGLEYGAGEQDIKKILKKVLMSTLTYKVIDIYFVVPFPD